jgi:hypothetical protein
MDRLDRRIALGATLLALLTHVVVRLGAGLWGALGTDAALWGMTAMDLRVGAPPLVPPGYPALVALGTVVGAAPVSAGWVVAMASAALLPGAVFLAARGAGASRVAAGLAGAATLVLPDAGAWAQQVQPDATAALLLVALAGALASGARAQRTGATPAALWAAAALAGVLPLVREHGGPAAAITIVVLLGLRAWRPAAAALALWWLGPLVVGLAPGLHPADVPWGDRAGGALQALTTTDPRQVPFARELPREARAAYMGLVASGDVVGRLRWHAARSLRLAWDGWLLVGAAGLGLLSLRRRDAMALGALLLPALPALLIWSQRRHVLLLVPVALVGLAVATRGRARGVSLGAIALAAALSWPAAWSGGVAGMRTERFRAEHLARTAGWLRDHAPGGSLLGGVHQDLGLYHPLPRHDPDGSAADWRTFFVGRGPPRGLRDWQRVFDPEGDIDVWQKQPDATPRPCADAPPEPRTPHLAVHLAHAELIGCDLPPGDAAPPSGAGSPAAPRSPSPPAH